MSAPCRKRTYSELLTLPTFLDRFTYLKLDGSIGEETFGFDRYVNQRFYRSKEWKSIRDFVIVRDLGCDLAVPGREIFAFIYVHHMNPIAIHDIRHSTEFLLDPEFLICTSRATHNAIHYGDESLLLKDFTERRKNDTIPWRS